MEQSQIQVQGTNDSSIVSKLSMVERGYFDDPFIKHFVKKPARRSPLINRCYHARAVAVSKCLKKFVSDVPGSKQIVSLGAGFDTSYYRLKGTVPQGSLTYVEIDFSSVMQRKVALAERAGLLNGHQQQVESDSDHIIYRSSDYICIGFDLCSVGQELKSILSSAGVDFLKPTLLLSEVVLAYLPSARSSAVLRWISQVFKNATMIIFEQVNPSDSFGRVMCKHFKQIGGTLLSIGDYPTIEKHVERHRSLGFAQCNAVSLDRLFHECPSTKERERVRLLEVFDEFEAWHRACQHYFILCSTNSREETLMRFCKTLFEGHNQEGPNQPTRQKTVSLTTPESCLSVKCYGHCTCVFKHQMPDGSNREFAVVFGGFGLYPGVSGKSPHQRLHENLTVTDLSSMRGVMCQPHDEETLEKLHPYPMFASVVNISANEVEPTVLIFGGRNSPKKCSSHLTEIKLFVDGCAKSGNDPIWAYSGRVIVRKGDVDWPDQRWRHSAVAVRGGGRNYMALFGGKDEDTAFNDFWCFDVGAERWSRVELDGEKIGKRHSHSMCVAEEKNFHTIYISGGLNCDEIPSDEIFSIQIRKDQMNNATVQRIIISNLLPRFSHTSHAVKGHLLLFGGVTLNSRCRHGDQGQPDSLDMIQLGEVASIRTILVEDDSGEPLMLHNHTSALTCHRRYSENGVCVGDDTVKDLKLYLFGGGDNCFSFGTFFNKSALVLDLNELIT